MSELKRYSMGEQSFSYTKGLKSFLLDLYTPYGGDIDEIQIREYIQENLFLPEVAEGDIRWAVLCQKETPQGTLHRTLIMPIEAEIVAASNIDALWSKPCYVLGLLGSLEGSHLWKVQEGEEIIWAGIEQGEILFFHHEHISESLILSRIQEWKSLFQTEVEVEEFSSFSQEKQADGFKWLMQKPWASGLNLLSTQQIQKSGDRREWKKTFSLWKWSLVACLLAIAILSGFSFWQHWELEKQQENAKGYLPAMQKVQSLSKVLEQKIALLEKRKSLWKAPISWKQNLSILSQSLPKGARFLNLQGEGAFLKGGMELLNWDDAESWEKKLLADKQFASVKIARKRRTKSGRIRMQVEIGF